MRILIAEDEPDIATTYKKVLEARGHQVIITENGKRCLEIFRQYNNHLRNEYGSSGFDAVVLDYKMPQKNGLEVAKEILNLHSKQRIIFASAYVMDTLKDAVTELKRAVELIQKPFHLQDLIDILEDIDVSEKMLSFMSVLKRIKDPNNLTDEDMRDLLKAATRAHRFSM